MVSKGFELVEQVDLLVQKVASDQNEKSSDVEIDILDILLTPVVDLPFDFLVLLLLKYFLDILLLERIEFLFVFLSELIFFGIVHFHPVN